MEALVTLEIRVFLSGISGFFFNEYLLVREEEKEKGEKKRGQSRVRRWPHGAEDVCRVSFNGRTRIYVVIVLWY